MKVEFIYDPDCPNVAEARAQLLRAFTETGISPRWAEWSRDSAEAPAYARGFGSPTLLVNGHDVAEQTSAHGNACCRLYAMLIPQERCFPSSKLSPYWKHADWSVQPSGGSFHSRCPLS